MDFQNEVLSQLTSDDLSALQLEPVELPRGRRLEQSGRGAEHVYFLNYGLASVVAAGRGVEIGLIGREGMTGIAPVMGADSAPHDTIMQIAGKGVRARLDRVRQAIDASTSLRRVILGYAQLFLSHVGAGAAANARNKVEERLARWLAVARERADTDELHLTHDVIGQLLGVRRAGVTIALKDLQHRGLIECHRGAIKITNRAGLIEASHGAYQLADEMTGRGAGSSGGSSR